MAQLPTRSYQRPRQMASQPARLAQIAPQQPGGRRPPMNPVGTVLPDGANSASTAPVVVPPSNGPQDGRNVPQGANGSNPANSTNPANPADGATVLRLSAKQLTSYPSLQAKIRHQITMYGQQMRGAGAYYQQTQGDELQLRMEMKIPVGQQIASLQHVCDGRHLWMRKAINTKVDLQRVDLLRVRAVAGPDWRPGWQQAMTGGLPRLLGALADHFQFAQPRSMTWNGQTVWRLRGSLHKSSRSPNLNSKTADSPTHVEVILDRQSLFPYRINYFCAVQRDEETQMKPLVAIELYDVVIGDVIPPQRFVYQAENYRNTTDAFIASLAKPLQPSAEAEESP